jgi:ABC-type nickel/cobalt efflux system permease component RcnA
VETWQIIVIVLGVLVAVGAIVAWSSTRRQRTQRLTEQYGPEYQRVVESAGDQREAEHELQTRSERVQSYEIRALSTDERDRYSARWKETQAHFVDDPSSAISEADRLVQEVMHERGYPMVDFEQRAADISVDHPHVVEEYRAAHDVAERHAAGSVETEELRQAMVHYRALFEDLLETDEDASEPAPQPEPQAEPEPPTADVAETDDEAPTT